MTPLPKRPSVDELQLIIDAHLPSKCPTREDALKLAQSESRILMWGVWGSAEDRIALEKIAKALRSAAKHAALLSPQVRRILERELSKATRSTWRPSFCGRTLIALKRASYSEGLGDNPAQTGWRAMAIVDACEDVWSIRTGQNPPSIVDGHSDRSAGPFRLFAESVFKVFGENQLVSTAQLRLREFEGTRCELAKSSGKKTR